jgi:hypothetical protein
VTAYQAAKRRNSPCTGRQVQREECYADIQHSHWCMRKLIVIWLTRASRGLQGNRGWHRHSAPKADRAAKEGRDLVVVPHRSRR